MGRLELVKQTWLARSNATNQLASFALPFPNHFCPLFTSLASIIPEDLSNIPSSVPGYQKAGATCFCFPHLFIVDFHHCYPFSSSLPRRRLLCIPPPPLHALESLTFSLPSVPLSHSDARPYIWPFCRGSLAPGGFSWNQFTLPVPSHWSTIYRPSTAGAAGRPFNRYIRCLTWQSVYGGRSPPLCPLPPPSSPSPPCFKHTALSVSGIPLIAPSPV